VLRDHRRGVRDHQFFAHQRRGRLHLCGLRSDRRDHPPVHAAPVQALQRHPTGPGRRVTHDRDVRHAGLAPHLHRLARVHRGGVLGILHRISYRPHGGEFSL
ncbi:unnamed protein product, partial [Ectocarpus sp. 13 AM-2016]